MSFVHHVDFTLLTQSVELQTQQHPLTEDRTPSEENREIECGRFKKGAEVLSRAYAIIYCQEDIYSQSLD